MFITKSLTLDLFKRYDIASNHRMCVYLWVLTYGYLVAQVLKLNEYIIISKSEQTAFEFVYDLLNMLAYSVCLFYLCGLNNPVNDGYYMDTFFYLIPFTLSIGVFMYLGEVEWLNQFVVEWGFWETLDPTAVVFLAVMGVMCIILIVRQCLYRESNWIKLCCFVCIYILSWVIIDCVADATYVLHLHHAFIAALLSIFFSKWTNYLTCVIHAICLGVWVEGMNVIGSEELQIFMNKNNETAVLDFNSSSILLGIVIGVGVCVGMYTYFLPIEYLI